MIHYYFIDGENVNHQISKILPNLEADAKIFLYYAKNPTIPMLTFADAHIMESFKHIEFVPCVYGKRVFPLQIATHIGMVASDLSNPDDAIFTIISDNLAFHAVAQFLEDRNLEVEYTTLDKIYARFTVKPEHMESISTQTKIKE